MDQKLYEELFRLRNDDPKTAIERVKELGNSRTEKVIRSIVLIDSGDSLNSFDVVNEGVELLHKAIGNSKTDANTRYNLANGYQVRARLNPDQSTRLSGQISEDRFKARVNFGSVFNSQDAEIEIRSQALTNIGILFLETGRWVEAIDCFQIAQKLLPSNAVAAFQEMRRNLGLAGVFSREPYLYKSFCHPEAQLQRIRHLADVVDDNLTTLESFAGSHAVEIAERAIKDAKTIKKIPKTTITNEYYAYVEKHNLALSLYCSPKEYNGGLFDLLTVPTVTTDSAEMFVVPEIYAMMNVMKADYVFARQLLHEVQCKNEQTFIHETATYADTLDHSVYGARYSALTVAQRIAFDILDKIAVALASYLKIKGAQRKTFKDLWGSAVRDKGYVPCPIIEAEFKSGNAPLIALHNVYQDISKDEIRGDGFMGAQKQFRNASTHRFTVLHDAGSVTSVSASKAVEHKDIVEFENLTMDSLRLARACLFYYVETIIFIDKRDRKADEFTLNIDVPDHDFIRGRKN